MREGFVHELIGRRARGLDVKWVFDGVAQAPGGDEEIDWVLGVARSDGDCCDICGRCFRAGDWMVWERFRGRKRVVHFMEHIFGEPLGKLKGG